MTTNNQFNTLHLMINRSFHRRFKESAIIFRQLNRFQGTAIIEEGITNFFNITKTEVIFELKKRSTEVIFF